jgi:hypothetical protein
VWTAALGKILTLDNLKKRQVIVIDWYCMCKKSRETINHLLLHYEVARDLWFQPFVFLALSGLCPKGWCSCWCAGEVSWEAVVD